MNRKEYNSDTRYEKVFHNMELLGIQDVTTNRQHRNGTVVWQLPIRVHTAPSITKFIEVASFSTGYVRNQNSGYSNYQLNKRCESNPEYYPEQKYNADTGEHVKTGKYIKWTTRGCKLIPIEIDRLEYLITYCLKNYYIKNANQVAGGKYVPEWYHNNKLEQVATHTMNCKNSSQLDLESEVRSLESKYQASQADLEQQKEKYNNLADAARLDYDCGHYARIRDLENKLDTIKRISEY